MTTNSAMRPNVWTQLTPDHRVKLVFLAVGFLSFLLSVYLWFFVDREIGIFVGLWVPALHSLGSLVLVGERSARDG